MTPSEFLKSGIWFLLLTITIFKSYSCVQHAGYFVLATCQNGTVEIHGEICKTYATVHSKHCISHEKFNSIIKKFDNCHTVVKSTNSKVLNGGELVSEYENVNKRIWKRQISDTSNCNAVSPPKPGKVNCRIFYEEITCIGICNNGYRFSDGKLRKILKCIQGRPWFPKSAFPTCQPQCNPKCQNGGTCVEVNVCSCPDKFRGELCQYPVSLCGVSKTSSASSWLCNHTNYESRCRISCYPPGSVEAKNNYYIHVCSVQGMWNPPLPPCVAPRAVSIISCPDPGGIANGARNISFSENGWFIVGSAVAYYCDYDDEMAFIIICEPNGRWSGSKPNCLAEMKKHSITIESTANKNTTTESTSTKDQCNPKCQNGGTCVEDNACSCPDKFRGELCQYPVSLCGVSKTSSASSWLCNHTNYESRCRISCYPPGSVEAKNNYYIHVCSVQGMWNPPLPPCVTPRAVSIASCLDPGLIVNGARNVSFSENGWFIVGSALAYFCDYDDKMAYIMICESNGRWSGAKPNCLAEMKKHSTTTESTTTESITTENTTTESTTTESTTTQSTTTESTTTQSTTTESITTESTSTEVSCPEVVYPKNTEVRMFFPNTETRRMHVVVNVETNEKDSNDSEAKTFPIGTKIQYKCKSRYYNLYGSEYQTCELTGTWSGNKPVCLPDCGKSDGPRQPLIVGGNKSEAGMWPWQVALSMHQTEMERNGKSRSMNFVVCGGSLINERYVVTAAHCVAIQHSNSPLPVTAITTYLGKHSRDNSLDDKHVQMRKVQRIIINEDYDFVKFEADIALLELEKPVELTTRVQPICLPTEATARDNLRPGQLGVVTGWGLTEEDAFSTELRETVIPVISREECEKSYQHGLRSITVTERMICAGGSSSDTCSGDSGGPFAFLDPESSRKWVLEGIISWGSGAGCGRDKEYSGFTKVVRFVDWIKTFL